MNRQGLPAYLRYNGGRAFLNISLDIQGKWSAGYIAWHGTDEYGYELAMVVGPAVNDADSPQQAMKMLAKVRKQKA